MQREDFALSIPNKAVDAFNHGRLVLTSCQGHLSETLEENDAGFYYDSEDPASLVAIVSDYLSNEILVQSMGSNARKLYERKFDFVKNYKKLAEKLVAADT